MLCFVFLILIVIDYLFSFYYRRFTMATPAVCSCGQVAGNKWCIQCNEGVCRDCEKLHCIINMSRDHKIVELEEYERMQTFFVSKTCEEHGEELTMFCKTHYKPLCESCVELAHYRCSSDIITLAEVARKAKDLTAFDGLEEYITQPLSDVEFLLNCHREASEEIDKQVKNIKESVQNIRSMINKHLDRLEADLLLELNTKFDECTSKNKQVLEDLNSAEKDLSILKQQLHQMKNYGSDVQIFLGRHKVKDVVFEKIAAVEPALKTAANNYMVGLRLHPMTTSLLKDWLYFGSITISEMPITLPQTPADNDLEYMSDDFEDRNELHVQLLRTKKKEKPRTKKKLKSILKRSH